ncbi:MAG TPA: ABC transporter ATP-binding protein [Erysipelotrichaceae bacterium]|nr:ABC transporter ATP-binding protein [Erysipelotrichaceae bacterium]
MITNSIIEVKNLHKSYGEVKAVKGIDFEVQRKSFFAFLGPNGAGKSTTIDILCTLLAADRGEVIIDGHVLGKEDSEIRKIIGVVFQHSVLDARLTIKENLQCRGTMYGLKKTEIDKKIVEITELLKLQDIIKRPYGKLSGGQRRRCDIARALLSTPKILFLDEPTTGLDPQSRKSIESTIQTLKEKHGVTIFLTTHYMEEAANADKICIIDNGKIVADGSPAELKDKYSSDKLILYSDRLEELKLNLSNLKIAYKELAGRLVVEIEKTFDAIELVEKVRENLISFEVAQGSMDDVFINITGKQLRDDDALVSETKEKAKKRFQRKNK